MSSLMLFYITLPGLEVTMGGDTSLNNTNLSRFMTILTMESLDIPQSSAIFIFIFGIITYCLILFFQSMMLVIIIVKRDLHRPMYILLFNLISCDLMGAMSFYPQMLSTILSQNREISYLACVAQGMLFHFYLCGSLLFLSVMAYDRYIAICKPLRYHNLMTQGILVKLVVMVWFVTFGMMGSLFALTLSKTICRTNIVDTYCNNPSLMKLSCEDITFVNYYGLFVIAVGQGFSITLVSLTYIKILITCLSTKQKKSISKAIQTCGTHLVVFLSFEINTFFLLVSHRLESVSPHLRRAFGVSVVIFPLVLNPLIYGMNTKEIRQTILTLIERLFLLNRKLN
ncbi:olfactory receptor 52Z1P-like [Clarias gariepinus]|uniref:olfactory receptor 52K2-like n=1 Tax=Clarias gariepinus TaxID=13013 RepID=UPI00234E2475|nr:olfactory receptor 52K2-like [Clarias gariepinus]